MKKKKKKTYFNLYNAYCKLCVAIITIQKNCIITNDKLCVSNNNDNNAHFTILSTNKDNSLRCMCCTWFTLNCAWATWVHVLDTVCGAMRRLRKSSIAPSDATTITITIIQCQQHSRRQKSQKCDDEFMNRRCVPWWKPICVSQEWTQYDYIKKDATDY